MTRKFITTVSNVDPENNNESDWTVEDALTETGFGRYNICLVVVCSWSLQAMGLDLFGPSFVIAAAYCDLKINLQQRAFLTATPLIGVLVGSFFWGYVSDQHGRRLTLVLSMAFGFIFAALSSLAPGWKTMALLKLMSSAFTSASNSAAYTLIGESCGQNARTRPLLLATCAIMCSHGVSAAFAYPILKLDFSIWVDQLKIYLKPWRLLALVLSLPCLGTACFLLLFHESPKFLASRGETEEALRVLRKIYSYNSGENEESFVVKKLVAYKEDDITNLKSSFFREIWRQTSDLFRKPLLTVSLRLFYMVIIIYMTASAFIIWLPYIMNSLVSAMHVGGGDRNLCSALESLASRETFLRYNSTIQSEQCNDTVEDATIFSAMTYGALACFANLLLSLTCVQKKRLAVICILTLSGMSAIMINLIKEVTAGVIFYFFFMMSALCMGVLSVYFVELYPTGLRGTASCLAVMVGRSMGFVGVNAIGAVITNHCEATFYFWSMLLFSAMICSWFLPKDTKVTDENEINPKNTNPDY